MYQEFRQQVYELVKRIPRGKVLTYGIIATKVGKPRWARQVGWALHQNNSSKVPCHRIVDRNGRLAPNFAFDGAIEQRKRLEVEKVEFKDEMHVDMERCLW